MRTARSRARSDLVAIICMGIMFGTFNMLAVMYALRERWLEAGITSIALPLLVVGMVIVARRTLRKITD